MKLLTLEPIQVDLLLSSMKSIEAGGIVLFSGNTRNSNQGRSVLYLEFESYEPMAERMIAEIVLEAKKKWNLIDAICVHRLGRVDLGEPAVCIVTSSAHRDEAYKANQEIINRVKHEVPIWKREFFEDGTIEWGVQCPGCAHESHLK
ncbi:MAG: molybdenum cofactor biosynthesis protein MoaE [Leptospiraceae bacterium]|nr:molybdenum cofactor biosynthesis protein MoaE [Leptospiraceae bacterium]